MKLPILINHDSKKQVGSIYTEDKNVIVEFIEGNEPTREEFFNMFGCSCRMLDITNKGKVWYVKKAIIYYFNLEPIDYENKKEDKTEKEDTTS